MNEVSKNLWQRINAAQTEVDYIQKDPKKNGMQYSYASHDKVTAAIRPVLVKHGVLYYPIDLVNIQDGNRTQVKLTVRFVNVDTPSEFIDVPSLGYGIDGQDKGPGKAISYAVKYALLKTLGLETGDDPDLDQDVEHKPASNSLPPTHPNLVKNSMDEKNALCKEIDDIQSMAVLTRWKIDNGQRLEALSEQHFFTVSDSYKNKKRELDQGAAA